MQYVPLPFPGTWDFTQKHSETLDDSTATRKIETKDYRLRRTASDAVGQKL